MNKHIKYIIIFLSAFVIRLIPFRAPNIEPLMTVIMPLGKIYGGIISFTFGFLSIVFYDAVTSGLGIWTLVTAIVYGLLGVGANFYFKNRSGWKSYASYAVIATIVYDVVTGLTIGPLFFGQSFLVSLTGQIPFTILHLLGNVSFAIVLSPLVEKFLVKSEKKIMLEKVVLVS